MIRISLLLMASTSLFGLPQAPSIASGTVEMQQEGTSLKVLASNRSIINWEDFSIQLGEEAIFTLGSSNDTILNRVTGKKASSLFGDLRCNGRLILINPSGVLIGPSGKVDTASLLISTLDLLDDDFLGGGDLHFFGADAQGIVNHGSIVADGKITLLAPVVTQLGSTKSLRGEVTLASCHEAILDTGSEKIRISPRNLECLQEEGLHCGGIVQALEARLLADGSLSSLAINLDGIVEATSVVSIDAPGGEVALRGAIRAVKVAVEASRIALDDGTHIDVTGETNGGKCRIEGSDWITMAPSAAITASCLKEGMGGEVILTSTGRTQFEGIIHAQGGPFGGDGGFVEVSGADLLFKGTVSTLAPLGQTGMLLIDPLDITIASAASALINGLPNGPFSPMASACAPGPGHAILQDTDLTTALGMTNVLIDTTGTVGACPGDIIFDSTAVVSYASANSLTLAAAGAIRFNASVINTAAGAITITSATDVNVTAGAVTVSVETNGGPISLSGVSGDLNIQGGTAMNAMARILAASATLDVAVGGDINVIGGSQSGASATLRNSAATLTISNAANIFVTGGTNPGADASIFSGSNGDAIITCTGNLIVDTTPTGAPASVTGDGDLTAIIGGDLQVNADGGGFAAFNGSFMVSATVGGDILVNGLGGGFATIFGDREDAFIQADGSIILNGTTQMYSGNQPNMSLTLIAGVDIQANGTTQFNAFSPAGTGSITLVVDNLFPSAPGFGPGQFILSAASMVDSMGGEIQIFTADPSQNMIDGTLAAMPFMQGPPLTDTNTERYGVYFPDPFFVADYVVFYKTPIFVPPPPSPPVIIPIATLVILAQPVLADNAEMFRLFHPFSEYIYGAIRFSQTFTDGTEQRFRLREKSYPREWFEIEYDPAKF